MTNPGSELYTSGFSLSDLFCHPSNRNYFYWRYEFSWKNCPLFFPAEGLGSRNDSLAERLGFKYVNGSNVIPIFVIFNEKVSDLRELILSFHEIIETSFRIVIIDFGSVDPHAVKFLNVLEIDSVKVIRMKKLRGMRMLNNVLRHEIKQYLSHHPEVKYYVVTDSDISLSDTKGDILEVFGSILDEFPVNVVGPALRLDDLPSQPFYKGVREWESQFWNHPAKTFELGRAPNRTFMYSSAPIDTTFGMYRAIFPFKNGNTGMRMHSPYAARHVDWYYDNSTGYPPEFATFICNSKSITHLTIPGLKCKAKLNSFHNLKTPHYSYICGNKTCELIILGHGIQIHSVRNDTVFNIKTVKKEHERDLHVIERILGFNADMVFVDIYAHVGILSLFASHFCHKVIALEPREAEYDLLESNSKINTNAEKKIIRLNKPVTEFSRLSEGVSVSSIDLDTLFHTQAINQQPVFLRVEGFQFTNFSALESFKKILNVNTTVFISVDQYSKKFSKDEAYSLASIIMLFSFRIRVQRFDQKPDFVYDVFVDGERICFLCKYVLSFQDIVLS